MRFLYLLLLAFCFVTHPLYSQRPQYRVNYESSWIEDSSRNDEAKLGRLFQVLNQSILGTNDLSEFAQEGCGSIILPVDAEELLYGYRSIRDVFYSPSFHYLCFLYAETEGPNSIAHVFDNRTGERIALLRDVRQVKFTEDDAHLIVTQDNKWSLWKMSGFDQLFSDEYAQEYYTNGYIPDNILILDHNHFLIREANSGKVETFDLFSIPEGKITYSQTVKDGVSWRNIKSKGKYLAFTETENLSRKGDLIVIDWKEDKKPLKLRNAKFLSWADNSNTIIYQDFKSQKLFRIDLDLAKKWKPIEATYTGDVLYGKQDSCILVNPQAYSFDRGVIRIYESSSGKLIKEIVGTKAKVHSGNSEYFIVDKFENGETYPSLYRFNDMSEVIRLDLKDKMRFSNSGRYLILEQYRTNLYRRNRFSIIDLHTSQRKLRFENDVFIDYFDDQNGFILTNKKDLVGIYNIETREQFHLYGTTEGWLCFDDNLRYDASSGITDRIYYSCFAHGPQSVFPLSHINRELQVDGLWTTLMRGKGTSIQAPIAKGCQSKRVGDDLWVLKSDPQFYLASFEKKDLPSVSFVINEKNDIVKLENYSGKPVRVHFSEILYQCDVWNGEGSALMFTFYVDNFGEYLAMTPDGYFTKSPRFRGRVAISISNKIYDMEQLFEKYFRPDVLEGILTDKAVKNRLNNDLRKGILLPPKLLITNANKKLTRGAKIDQKNLKTELSLTIKAIDSGGGIGGINVFNNKKLIQNIVPGISFEGDSLITEVKVFGSPGSNDVEIIGYSKDMTESIPYVFKFETAYESLHKPNLYLLTVGINEYKNSAYNLNYCVQDANAFRDTLLRVSKQLFNRTWVKTLTNEEANKANVISLLKEVGTKAQPQDVFLFFYAGHGIATESASSTEFFFVMYDLTQMTDSVNRVINGISGSEFKDILTTIQANKQISIIDACNSGALAEQFTLRGPRMESSIAKLSRATGSAVYASTTSDQSAAEYQEIGHGVFTYVLLEAMSGEASLNNCEITASGLKAFIDDEVPKATKRFRGAEQYPTTFLFGQDFPFGLKCKAE